MPSLPDYPLLPEPCPETNPVHPDPSNPPTRQVHPSLPNPGPPDNPALPDP